MRDRWMKSLSEDDRTKLTEAQKQFHLRYTLLVTTADLMDVNGTTPPIPEKKLSAKKLTDSDEIDVPRPTESVLSAAEEAHLAEINQRASENA